MVYINIFDEMNKYHTGETEEGLDTFAVPLAPDEHKMIGRECHNEECQPRYFKISQILPDGMEEKAENFSNIDLVCPYCGVKANMQEFHTESQIEWIQSIMFRDISGTVDWMFDSTFNKRSASNKSFSVSYKGGNLPSVRHYMEEHLRNNIVCDNCSFAYAVYGISFSCPLCGAGTLLQHLQQNAKIIQSLLEESEGITSRHGADVGNHLIGNALEDLVSLFEGFLKHVYIFRIQAIKPLEEAHERISNVGTTFQRLDGASKRFADDFNCNLFEDINRDDHMFLEKQFLKRHVVTHNLGLVDAKYLRQANTFQKQGTEVEFSASDVQRALEIVVLIVTNLIKQSDL